MQIVVVQAVGDRRRRQPLAPAHDGALRSPRSARVRPLRRRRGRREPPPSASAKRAGIAAGRMSGTPSAGRASRVRRKHPLQAAVLRQRRRHRLRLGRALQALPSDGPPSGRSIQPRGASSASGSSTTSGASRASSAYRPTSKAVAGPAAFIHTSPPVVGARSTVAHGRTRGCSTAPVRSRPASASRRSIQPSACSRHAAEDQRATLIARTYRRRCHHAPDADGVRRPQRHAHPRGRGRLRDGPGGRARRPAAGPRGRPRRRDLRRLHGHAGRPAAGRRSRPRRSARSWRPGSSPARSAACSRSSATGHVAVARAPGDLDAAREAGVLAAVAHIEGAEAVDPGLHALDVLHAAGLRSLGPVWSRPNAFAHGVPFAFPSSPDTGPGLTPAGRRLVRRCAELGIAVDLSHLNEAGFWDVAAARARAADRLALGRARAVPGQPQPHRRPARRDRRLRRARRDRLRGRLPPRRRRRGPRHAAGDDRRPRAPRRRPDRRRARRARLGLRRRDDPAELGDAAGLPRLLDAIRAVGFSEDEMELIAWGNWRRVLEAAWAAS